MTQHMMNRFSWMVPALLLFTVLAKADEPEVAEVTRTSNFDLAVTEIKEVTFSNVRKFSDPKSPKGDYPPEGIYYADVEFTVMLVPLACNTSYYRGEILGRIGAIGDHWDTNPTIKVDFGTLDTLGAGSTCPGLPPRQAHVKLWGVVNGIGKKERRGTAFPPDHKIADVRSLGALRSVHQIVKLQQPIAGHAKAHRRPRTRGLARGALLGIEPRTGAGIAWRSTGGELCAPAELQLGAAAEARVRRVLLLEALE